MKVDLKLVTFGVNVFSHGKNHGNKIEASKDTSLYYETEGEFVVLEKDGKVTIFDSFLSADLADPKQLKELGIK